MSKTEAEAEHLHLARNKHEWRKALRKAKLPASCYIVGLYLCDECLNSKTGKLHPKVATIAAECDIPEGTAKDGLSGLKKAGLMISMKRFRGPPDYLFARPKAAENPAAQSDDERMNSQPSNGRKSSRQTDEYSSDSTMEGNMGRSTMEKQRRAGQSGGSGFAGPSALSPFGRQPPLSDSDAVDLDDDLLQEGRFL